MTQEQLVNGLGTLYEPEPNSGCWLWVGGTIGRKNDLDYGRVRIDGCRIVAHRAMYEAIHGPVPSELCVMHTCDTPLCVNPDHLKVGTPAENNEDRDKKGRGSRGGRNGHSKLSESDVRVILGCLDRGERVYKIARRYGMSHEQIRRINKGMKWKHIERNGQEKRHDQ